MIEADNLKLAERVSFWPVPDTHTHLGDLADGATIGAVVRRAQEAGIDRILAVGEDLASSTRAVALAAQYGSVYAAVGLHPQHADRFAADAPGLRTLVTAPRVVAIGEIGLDFVRSTASPAVQHQAFRTQLGWAQEAGLPVSVHNRGADEQVLEATEGTHLKLVMHCFAGDAGLAARCVQAGWYLSFAGNLTYKRSESLREAVRVTPPHRLLVETDSPVLAPQRWRGRPNEPSYLRETVRELAKVRAEAEQEVCSNLTAVADSVFHWGQV